MFILWSNSTTRKSERREDCDRCTKRPNSKSGPVLSAPTIVFAAGKEASVQSSLSSGMLWELEVEVSSDGGEASWSSIVTMGDQVMSVSTGSVRLAAE